MRSSAIRLLHDDTGSALATWFKAIFLTPAWFLPLLFPIGLIFRLLNAELFGFSFIFGFGFMYFVRDLLRKRIVIDDQKINCGLRSLMLEKISKISLKRNRFGLENILQIDDSAGKCLRLTISRIPAEHFAILIDVLQRRAPNVQIDAGVDGMLRYKKWKQPAYQETTSTVSIDFHPNRGWENLPKNFQKSFLSWGRYVGPVGTLVLTFPIWLMANSGVFAVVRDYSDVSKNKGLYIFLSTLLQTWFAVSERILTTTGAFLFSIASQPAALTIALATLALLLAQLSHALFSANRITMDSNELSLDRWNFFSSYNTVTVRWTDVTEVGVEVKDGDSILVFRLSNDRHPFTLPLYAIDSVDTPRLLQALQRFAPDCRLAPELIELLEPSAPKSYTQLWLQSLTAAPERKNLEPLTSGDLLDNARYEVIRRLGVGGQGTAYLCYDLSRDEKKSATMVALKETIIPVFVENLVRQKTIEQFFKEVELLSKIECDGIVRLLDHFVDDHRAYLVLEHVEGLNLRDAVAKDGPMPAGKVRSLVLQMCDILEHLHEQNVIHRDFAPDNLMLTPDGKLKLIDFNVAQTVSDGSTDTIVGKHAYVPPEQFRGKPTSQSDLYALGATVYFLLSGQDPEPISESSLPDAILQPPLSEPPDGELANLDRLIQRCTKLSLDARLKSIGQVREMLRENSKDEPSGPQKEKNNYGKNEREKTTIKLPQQQNEMQEVQVSGSKE